MKKVILTSLLVLIAIAGAVVPAFAESGSINVTRSDTIYLSEYNGTITGQFYNSEQSNYLTDIDPNFPILYTVSLVSYPNGLTAMPNNLLWYVVEDGAMYTNVTAGGTTISIFNALDVIDDYVKNIGNSQRQMMMSMNYKLISYPVEIQLKRDNNSNTYVTGYLHIAGRFRNPSQINASLSTRKLQLNLRRYDIDTSLINYGNDTSATVKIPVDDKKIIFDKNNCDIEYTTENGQNYANVSFRKNAQNVYYTVCFYIDFVATETNYSIINCSYTTNNKYTSSDYNDKLDTIIDLLNDLQVQEVNNIYQNITINYDIDIENNIDSLIDNLKLNINDLSIDDPKFSLTNSDLEAENKLSVFKQIGTAIINVYDNNGLSYLYFVPIILLIIGAVII